MTDRWRFVLLVTVLAFLLPLVGAAGGRELERMLDMELDFVGAVLLAGVGLWMLWGSRDSEDAEDLAEKVSTLRGNAVLALGTTVDNLVLGFSAGLHGQPTLVIAAVSTVFVAAGTLLGLYLGGQAEQRWGRYATRAAGLLLIALAVAIWRGWLPV
jgi:manganese efflux pump family protein